MEIIDEGHKLQTRALLRLCDVWPSYRSRGEAFTETVTLSSLVRVIVARATHTDNAAQVRLTRGLLRANAVTVWLLAEENSMLERVAHAEVPSAELDNVEEDAESKYTLAKLIRPATWGLVGVVVCENVHMYVRDTTKGDKVWARLPKDQAPNEHKTVLAVPLRNQQSRLVGVLEVVKYRDHPRTGIEHLGRELVNTVAGVCGMIAVQGS